MLNLPGVVQALSPRALGRSTTARCRTTARRSSPPLWLLCGPLLGSQVLCCSMMCICVSASVADRLHGVAAALIIAVMFIAIRNA